MTKICPFISNISVERQCLEDRCAINIKGDCGIRVIALKEFSVSAVINQVREEAEAKGKRR